MLLPILASAQTANDIIARVSMIRDIVESPNGQMVFRQTKNMCSDFIGFHDAQAEDINELFNSQFVGISLAYKKYDQSYSRASLKALIEVIVKQEHDFRALLTPNQLDTYRVKFFDAEKNPNDAKNKAFLALFISDDMMRNYREED